MGGIGAPRTVYLFHRYSFGWLAPVNVVNTVSEAVDCDRSPSDPGSSLPHPARNTEAILDPIRLRRVILGRIEISCQAKQYKVFAMVTHPGYKPLVRELLDCCLGETKP
jgi:hypothetical protein